MRKSRIVFQSFQSPSFSFYKKKNNKNRSSRCNAKIFGNLEFIFSLTTITKKAS